ncbi:cupin domain-containing protein [Nocardioides mangrovi]|uniref:Cupin domain-containing protein n=1 Tax=Nocardioides mangrovi TaxID=2874580 RepID=A0ABS7UD47_9ACTN|nr:cupin domain-containing protein [Nocardioides mangrovi]MBZ5738583.1 cupin domain-containing protein [Nocardioides mangrovi]
MSARVLATDAFTVPLTDESHPGIWVDGGWPTAHTALLAEVGGTNVSVWEITDGVVSDIENDEVLLVLVGAGRLRFEDGDTIELQPGACVRVRAGDRTEWTVLSTVRALSITQR